MQRPPISTRDQLWQAIYEVTSRARAAVLADHALEASNLLHDELPPIFQSYFDTTVKPLLEQAKKDDAIVPLALTAGLDWIHDVQALGLVGDPGSPGPLAARRDDVFTQLVAIAEGALNRASDRCIAGDLGQVSRLEALERFAQQLGFSSGDVFQKIQRCLHFELDYNASWSIRQPTANGEDRAHTDFTTKIAGLKVNARVTRSIPEAEASQPLAYPTYTFTAENDCHADSLASSDEQRPFRVISLDVAAKITTKTDNQGRSTYTTGPPEVTLQMDPGQRTENITYTCSQGGGTMQRHWFDNIFQKFHSSEYASNVGIYTLTNWSPGTGGVLATKTYQVPLTGTIEKYGETSTFTLRHTPEK
jgi:hypothetical protein